jgi:hypothetical protein
MAPDFMDQSRDESSVNYAARFSHETEEFWALLQDIDIRNNLLVGSK